MNPSAVLVVLDRPWSSMKATFFAIWFIMTYIHRTKPACSGGGEHPFGGDDDVCQVGILHIPKTVSCSPN